MEISRLTRDGTAEPVSRDQTLRHERGQGNINFLCSADHEQGWQPSSVDPYSCYVCDHTYMHLNSDYFTVAYNSYPCTDARRTETCVAPRHVDASRYFYFFSERAAWGEGCGARLFLLLFFPLFNRPRAGLATV